jgi:hypothetical protein
LPKVGLPQAVAEVVDSAIARRTLDPAVLARIDNHDSKLDRLEAALQELRGDVATEVLKIGTEIVTQKDNLQTAMNDLKMQGDNNFQMLCKLIKDSQSVPAKMEDEASPDDSKTRGQAHGSTPPSKKPTK